MAFSDFKTLTEVQKRFEIRDSASDFVSGDNLLSPSEQFLQGLAFARQHLNVFRSEAARCEAIIYPILLENYKAYAERYMLWIREPLVYDGILSGTPDYFVATRSELGKNVVGTPVVMVVEAKKNDFEIGWGQCLAAMIAAQKINAQEINAQKINREAMFPVYGIVTDGVSWQFGKLAGDTFTENLTPFSLGDVPRLFGAIDTVFKAVQNGSIAHEEQ